MFRGLASVLGLAICLSFLIGLGNGPRPCAPNGSEDLPFESKAKSPESAVSAIAPGPQSACVSPDLDLAGFLAHPLLVTSEPALLQLHVEVVAHQQWQRFGLSDVAPFVSSRCLPIQT